MNEEEKLTFWKKLKISIMDFDKYQELAMERVIKTILYIAILVLIFSLIIAGFCTYQTNQVIANVRQYIQDNVETINFENNQLDIVLKNKEKKLLDENYKSDINIIIDTNLKDEEQINEAINEFSNQTIGILILKDKILIKNEQMTKPYTYSYADLSQQYNINKIDKQEVLNLLSPDTIKPLLFTVFGTLFLCNCILAKHAN